MDEDPSRPGAAQAVLPSGVAFLDPEEQVWEAMLEGWRRQQVSQRLRTDTIGIRLRQLKRFQRFLNSYPWQWQRHDIIDFSVGLMEPAPRALATLRQYQSSVRLFMAYASDARNGWVDECYKRFSQSPMQICDQWNTTEHHEEFDCRPERRPLTFDEIQKLFDYCDDRFGTIRQAKRKGGLAAARDSVYIKTAYAYGLRRKEACLLALTDFHHNPHVKDFDRFGSVFVRYGKAVRGGAPRRRIVHTVPEMDWIVDVMKHYLTDIRPLFGLDGHPGVFVTERGDYLGVDNITRTFGECITGAGLDENLTLHCLRHSYSTHLAEFGYDGIFIQEQLGHIAGSSTSIYTHVSSDYKNRQIINALERLYPKGES